MSDYDPFRHAEHLSITVDYRERLPHDGLWLPQPRAILLRPGMLRIQERCVLTHELAHAELGHRTTTPKNEVAANRLAASWLIDHDELVSYLRWTDDLPRVCLELSVTMRTMRTYLNVSGLARRDYPAGRGTYLAPQETASA